MRLYFHATNGEHEIRDHLGIEVADLEQARVQALRALEEFRREFGASDRGLDGWELRVVDATGTVVFTLDLD